MLFEGQSFLRRVAAGWWFLRTRTLPHCRTLTVATPRVYTSRPRSHVGQQVRYLPAYRPIDRYRIPPELQAPERQYEDPTYEL